MTVHPRLIALAVALSAAPLSAQEPLGGFLPFLGDLFGDGTASPAGLTALRNLKLGPEDPDGIGVTASTRQKVRNQDARLSIEQFQLGGGLPVWASGADVVVATGVFSEWIIDTRARLPVSNFRLPNHLFDIRYGGIYAHDFGQGEIAGASVEVGQAGDEPWGGRGEGTVNAGAFWRKPIGSNDAWLFTLTYQRPGQIPIPVPGVAYENRPNEQVRFVVGLPFSLINYRPTKEWEFDASYIPLTEIKAKATYHIDSANRLFGGYEWFNKSWFRADRVNRQDQLFYYEQRLAGGYEWNLGQAAVVQALGGFAFDRYFVETRAFSLGSTNRVRIDDGPFVGLRLNLKY